MIPLVFALTWFINTTRAGRAMRATAQDPEAARLMGINVNATISLTFLLGGMLAGAAGLVYALYETNVWYFQGFKAGLIAFTAAVMGGIGNVRGAVLGGLIIGVIQSLSDRGWARSGLRRSSSAISSRSWSSARVVSSVRRRGRRDERVARAVARVARSGTEAAPAVVEPGAGGTAPRDRDRVAVPVLLVQRRS